MRNDLSRPLLTLLASVSACSADWRTKRRELSALPQNVPGRSRPDGAHEARAQGPERVWRGR